MTTVNVPCGSDPSERTAWALPFRPAATCHATTWRPGLTAVTPKSNFAVRPGASRPRAHVLAYAVTAPPGPPEPPGELASQPKLHWPGGWSTTHTGREGWGSPGL